MFYRKLFCLLFLFLLPSAVSYSQELLDRTTSRVQTTLTIGWKQIGTITPKSVPEVDSTPWTIGCETLDRGFANYEQYKEYLVPLGIKRIRLQGGWATTEKVKGVYNFQWLDKIIDDAISRGLEIWLETDYGNRIYAGGGGPSAGGRFPESEEALAAWDKWVEAMAIHYQGKVNLWAMWNEPDLNKRHTPEEIARFNVRTAEIIKRVNPDARIGAFTFAGKGGKLLEECLRPIIEQNKTHLFEWVVYHGYSTNPDSADRQVREMQAVLVKMAPHLKLWQGESGAPSEFVTTFAMRDIPWSELSQSKWNTRRMLNDLGHDAWSSVFGICDMAYTDSLNRKGIIKINADRSLAKVKMAYYAIQHVVSVFDGTLKRLNNYHCEIEAEKKISWYAYRNPAGKDILVFWDQTVAPSDNNATFPVTISVQEGHFSDPVWCDVVTGRIYEIPEKFKSIGEQGMILTNIPVYDSPTFIVDRDVVYREGI